MHSRYAQPSRAKPEPDDDLTARLAAISAARYAGNHQIIIEPASAGPFRFPGREGAPDRVGVQFDATFATGPAKGERQTFFLSTEGVPKHVAGRTAMLLLLLADELGVEGASHAEIINNAARRLFPTARKPNPPVVTATIAARVVAGRSRAYLDLKALEIEGVKI